MKSNTNTNTNTNNNIKNKSKVKEPKPIREEKSNFSKINRPMSEIDAAIEKMVSSTNSYDSSTISKNGSSVTADYLSYHDEYIKKFGVDRTLVLMQVGSFYEAYSTKDRGPDLQKLEAITDANIAHKGHNKELIDIKNPLMWGFPMVATDKYVNMLVEENGYRLIMIDQVTPPPNVVREVVEIISPSTYLEGTYKPNSNFICAICIEEVKQKNGIVLVCLGLSTVDVSTGDVYIHESYSTQVDDKLGLDEALRFLKSLSPKETVIYREKLIKSNDEYITEYLDLKGRFYQFKDYIKDHNSALYQRKLLERVYPNIENFTSIIDTLGLSQCTYARKSLVNLLTYVSDHYEDLVTGLKEPIFYLSKSNMVLGNDAINQLNIVDSNMIDIPGSVKFHNLLDVVNKASTPMGKRHVKFRLVSPFTDIETLNNTYNIVETIIKSNMTNILCNYLKKIHDIERLYRKIKLRIIHPRHLVDFISSFAEIEEIINLITENDDLIHLFDILEHVNSIEKLNEYCKKTINSEKALLYNIGEAAENIFVKGCHPDLDKLMIGILSNHNMMDTLIEKLDEIITEANQKNNNNKLNNNKMVSLGKTSRDGYYLKLSKKRFELLKEAMYTNGGINVHDLIITMDDFKITELTNACKINVPFLEEKTKDINGIISVMKERTHKYYVDFLQTIENTYGNVITKMITIVTQIDYFTTIANVAKLYNYTKPIIEDRNNNKSFIVAEKIRHPIVERIIEHEYVPHDIQIGTSDLKGMLIYGLNSAGKSVLMKAIGISIIMAQAGFFVPAKKFTYYPYKSLYTRITGNDNLFRGLSSYSLEIVELNAILKRSDDSTLVIGDEVCRGTEHISGNAIVATTLLHLSDVGSSFVFATHLHELVNIDDIVDRKDIKAFHLSVEHDEPSDNLIYDRILKPGSGERIYGITVAKYIIKDDAFIKKALEIKNKLIGINNESTAISTKKCRYNSSVLMDRCSVCGIPQKSSSNSKSKLEGHHINFQKDCENGFVKIKEHIGKDHASNIAVLCESCHDKLHASKISIQGIKMTGGGKKIIYNK